MRSKVLVLFLFLVNCFLLQGTGFAKSALKKEVKKEELKFTITTSLGVMEGVLFYDKAPITVSNFVYLAKEKKYNGLIFHRVIPNFMIQTGDPEGTGRGGPGYRFNDEFHADLKHTKAGILSMANAGPNTNGSQFFITVAKTPWLDNRHAVFGEITKGLDIAIKISNVARDRSDRPKKEVKMISVKIEDIKSWKPVPKSKYRK